MHGILGVSILFPFIFNIYMGTQPGSNFNKYTDSREAYISFADIENSSVM